MSIACVFGHLVVALRQSVSDLGSGVSLEGALPGVVVGVVMPFSVPVGNALEFFITDVVVSIGVRVVLVSVDTLLTGDTDRWSVD